MIDGDRGVALRTAVGSWCLATWRPVPSLIYFLLLYAYIFSSIIPRSWLIHMELCIEVQYANENRFSVSGKHITGLSESAVRLQIRLPGFGMGSVEFHMRSSGLSSGLSSF